MYISFIRNLRLHPIILVPHWYLALRMQASIARRHSLELLNQNANVIVAGDLNDHPGQPVLRRIRGMDDTWPDLIQIGNAPYFADDALDTRGTYQFMGVRQQIDHILLSFGIKDTGAAMASSASTHAPASGLRLSGRASLAWRRCPCF